MYFRGKLDILIPMKCILICLIINVLSHNFCSQFLAVYFKLTKVKNQAILPIVIEPSAMSCKFEIIKKNNEKILLKSITMNYLCTKIFYK